MYLFYTQHIPKVLIMLCLFVPLHGQAFFVANDILETTIHSPTTNYYVHSLLGSGDEGVVYLAYDTNNQPVALKRLYHSSNAINEFMFGCQLDHPNIVKLIEMSDNFIIMEYITGTTIHLAKKHSQSKEKALENAHSFIDLIEYLCHHSFYYEDLHSNNIMFDQEGNIKLIDLGALRQWPEEGISNKTFKRYLKNIEGLLMEIQLMSNTTAQAVD